MNVLGACPRIEDLLRKRPFGQIFRPLSLNSAAIRLKCTKNLTQNGIPSLRPLFSDRLLGDKLIPLILEASGEHQAAAIDNPDKAERFRWIHSADEWFAIRRLRNQMVHDYMEDLNILTSAIQTAQKFVATLTNTTQKLHAEIQKRGWIDRV